LCFNEQKGIFEPSLKGKKLEYHSNCLMNAYIDILSLLKTHMKAGFLLPMIIEDPTEKVPQFILPMKSIYSKNLCFNEQKCIFDYC
jgi:hypothetical protein